MRKFKLKHKGILKRTCRVCGKDYPVEQKGLRCRACKPKVNKEYRKQYILKNKEKIAQANAAWAKNNKDKNRRKARAYLFRKRLARLSSQRVSGRALVDRDARIAALKANLAAL